MTTLEAILVKIMSLATVSVFESGFPPMFYWALVVMIMITSLLIASLWLFRKTKQFKIRQGLLEKISELEQLIQNSHKLLRYYENIEAGYGKSLGFGDYKYLASVRKIVSALDVRYSLIVEMLHENSFKDFTKLENFISGHTTDTSFDARGSCPYNSRII